MKDLKLKDQYPPEIDVTGGQIQTSGSLYNLVYLLLFTGPSWLNEHLEWELDSKIPELMNGNLTNQTRLDVIAEAERVLAVLVTKGIAESVTVDAEIPSPSRLNLQVSLNQPETDMVYQLNWSETEGAS